METTTSEDFLQKGFVMTRSDWCRTCNRISDHHLRFKGREGQTIFYKVGCLTCLEKRRGVVKHIQSLGLPNEKEVLEKYVSVSRMESMALNSWVFLVHNPTYLTW